MERVSIEKCINIANFIVQTTNNINPPFNDSGGPLPGTFKLLEFTFYWNRDCGKGITGTTIDGKGYG